MNSADTAASFQVVDAAAAAAEASKQQDCVAFQVECQDVAGCQGGVAHQDAVAVLLVDAAVAVVAAADAAAVVAAGSLCCGAQCPRRNCGLWSVPPPWT